MKTREIAEGIAYILTEMMTAEDVGDLPIPQFVEQAKSVSPFAAAGVLTKNEGLVIRLRDGREFQVTVVQSR